MAAVLNRTTKQYLPSANTPDYPTADWVINPDMSAVAGFDSKYWVITGDAVSLMSQPERDSVDETELEAFKNAVSDEFDRAQSSMRAFAEVLVDELNARAAKTNAILDAIDAANNLASLKASIGAIPDYPQRTLAQLKTAVRGKL